MISSVPFLLFGHMVKIQKTTQSKYQCTKYFSARCGSVICSEVGMQPLSSQPALGNPESVSDALC